MHICFQIEITSNMKSNIYICIYNILTIYTAPPPLPCGMPLGPVCEQFPPSPAQTVRAVPPSPQGPNVAGGFPPWP